MAAGPDDWRRRGQERYLLDSVFVLRNYAPPRPDWDHDPIKGRLSTDHIRDRMTRSNPT